MAHPPPLPDPFCVSWPLQFSNVTLAFDASSPGLRDTSLLLLAILILSTHLLTLLWRPWLPSSPVCTFPDAQLSCKSAGGFWCNFMWWSDCYLLPDLGFCGGWFCDLSIPLAGQCSSLIVCWWILARFLHLALRCIGSSLKSFSNSSHHPERY